MVPLPCPTSPVKVTQTTPAIQHFRRRFIYDDFIRHRRRANAFWSRFERSGRRGDLDSAIAFQEAALNACSHSTTDRAKTLVDLAFFLGSRYERWGEFGDLDKAILLERAALDLLSEGHPDRSISLNNIALSLWTRFEHAGRMEDLEESIALHRAALDLRPEGHPARSASLNNIAVSLWTRFRQGGRVEDLEDSIALHRTALDLRPKGHPERSSSLDNLALSLGTRFEQGGQKEDLDESIALHCAALELRPEGHPARSTSLDNVAVALRTRFEQEGRMEDLDESTTLHRAALDLRPKGHPDHSMSLNNLAQNLWTCFEQRGRMEDLEESITLHRATLDLCPEGHPYRFMSLNNLALTLGTRFDQGGRMEDLEETIVLHRAALDLCPKGHPARSVSLDNIALALRGRFEQGGRIQDLEESIALHRDALHLRPEGHPHRSISLNNLALSLEIRFARGGRMEDLDESITLHRAALDLRPEGHPDRSMSLDNIAISLATRFEQGGRMEDLEESIALHRAALCLRPEGHPQRSISLNNLALSLRMRFEKRSRMRDLSEIIRSYRSSATHPFSSYSSRIEAAQGWIKIARRCKHESLAEAYRTALSLLQRVLTTKHTVSTQHKFLSSDSPNQSLALDAASHAIDKGHLFEAIEILEQGRALLWTQLRGFRNPLQRLSRINAALAERLSDCHHHLEALIVSSESYKAAARTGDHENRVFDPSAENRLVDEKLVRMRRLYEEQEMLIEEIRGIPEFKDFLRAAPFEYLQRAASEGPVIVLNYSEYRCDALVVLPRGDSPCLCVPLGEYFYVDAAVLHEEFLRVRRESKVTSPEYDEALQKVMRFLWDRVVCGVIEKLKELGIKEGSHIWWCPTSVLSAFPFHAAGPYEDANGKTKYLLDDYVSSYTPTLTSLIKARTGIRGGKDRVKTLFVGDTSLRSTRKEKNVMIVIENLRKHMKSLVDGDATPTAVLEWLQKVRWVHFACHGKLDEEPFNSSFALPGGKLTLLDIARTNLPNAEFAFLSACHTAEQGSKYALDEALHLAAAMQFCGFRSVVGTMWQLLDWDGPFLANAVYEHLMRDLEGGEIRFKRGAAAVRAAALRLREFGEPDPKTGKLMTERWVNLVHIGA